MPNLIFGTKGAAQVLRDQEKMNREAQKLGDIYKADVREAKNLENAAKRIYTSLQTPQEKVLQQIRTIAKAHKEGFVERPQAKEGIKKLRAELKRLNEDQKKTEKTAEKTFGVGFVSSIAASLLAAISLKKVLADINQLMDLQTGKLQTAATPLGKLAQLAGGDTAKLDTLFAATKTTFSEGAFRTLDEAARLTFELESAGALDERKFFSLLQSVDDAASIAKTTKTLRTGFAGGDRVGTNQQLIGKALTAAGPAPGVSPSQVLEAAAFASSSAKKLGLTDEELFAAISRVSQVTGSATLAGTQVESLFTALLKNNFADEGKKGRPLFKVLEEINSLGKSEAGLIEFLGRKEAARGFSVLGGDVGAFIGRTREVDRSQQGRLAAETIANALRRPEIAATRLLQSGLAQKELATEEITIQEQASRARSDIIFAQEIQKGRSLIGVQTGQSAFDFFDAASGGGLGRAITEDQGTLERFQEQQLRVLEDINSEQKETNRTLKNGKGLIGVAK